MHGQVLAAAERAADPGQRQPDPLRREPECGADLPLVDVRGTASRPDVVLAATRDGDWERRSCGHGAKGQRYWDFAAHSVTVKGQRPAAGHTHTLLIRRALTPKVTKAHPEGILEVEYFLVHARTGTPIPQMITSAGLRWLVVM